MASLFTPESEKLRQGHKDDASRGPGAPGSPFKITMPKGVPESGKSQDSLGNPNGPLGYEHWKKENRDEEPTAESAGPESSQPGLFHVPGSARGEFPLRLGYGWEKLLVAQKKLCEKAKGLFTLLEAPGKYRQQRKSSMIQMKSRGSILNMSTEEFSPQTGSKKKDAA
jgi:hypothetical protein